MAQFDDISESFDGVQTTFMLAVNGAPAVLPASRELDISVRGVLLYEGEDYTVVGDQIAFNVAPLNGDLFAGEFTNLDVQYTNIINAPMIANGETIASAGQQTFMLSGVNGTPYNTHVHLNGVKLSSADFNTLYVGSSNALQITLIDPATSGDVLSISTSHQGGSSASVASGEVNGSALILSMTDGTSITIDVSSLMN